MPPSNAVERLGRSGRAGSLRDLFPPFLHDLVVLFVRRKRSPGRCILLLNESRASGVPRIAARGTPPRQVLSMRARILNCRTDAVLRRDLFAAAERDRTDTARFLALIADFDARRLYVSEGYASMHAFCVGALRMCEHSAYKRIQAARAAWRFPQLCSALAEGRLHLTAVFTLAPHLTPDNVDELVTACTHRTFREIQDLIARRFLGPRAALRLDAEPTSETTTTSGTSLSVTPQSQLVALPVDADPQRTAQQEALQSLDPSRRTDIHCTVDRENLEYARALLSHSIPSGELGRVIDRALEAVIREMERRKFGATPKPRASAARRASTSARHIPAHAKREVWKRDGGRCTFVGSNGHRCGERRFLEFDHVRPVARGGEGRVDDLRLRCRVHNQHEAERVFGTEFMAGKREAATRARAEVREAREAARTGEDATTERARTIASGLRNLGCRADEARQVAERAIASLSPEATLEECLRAALRSLGTPRGTRRDRAISAPAAIPKAIEHEVESLVAV
jgi:hypothetical protein